MQPSVPNARDEEPMDIMAFTTSVENVLSAYLNRNAALEYHPGLVQLVAPVSNSLFQNRNTKCPTRASIHY